MDDFFDFLFPFALFVCHLGAGMGTISGDGRFGYKFVPAEETLFLDLDIAAHCAPPSVLPSCSYLLVSVRFTSLHSVSILQILGDGNRCTSRHWDSGAKRGRKISVG